MPTANVSSGVTTSDAGGFWEPLNGGFPITPAVVVSEIRVTFFYQASVNFHVRMTYDVDGDLTDATTVTFPPSPDTVTQVTATFSPSDIPLGPYGSLAEMIYTGGLVSSAGAIRFTPSASVDFLFGIAVEADFGDAPKCWPLRARQRDPGGGHRLTVRGGEPRYPLRARQRRDR